MSPKGYKFNPDILYPYYKCTECGSLFLGNGPAIHREGCPAKDQSYASCIMFFGELQVEEAVQSGTNSPLLDFVRANHPELLENLE